MHKIMKPWMLPAIAVAYNTVSVVCVLLNERRVKPNQLCYVVRYALTIPAAIRGDLMPYITVASS